jgi:DtxR family Mn-dependent transcriptional regulator
MAEIKSTRKCRVSSSKEDYLEAIYIILKSKTCVGVKDISEFLGVKMSSVTGALNSLAGDGLVNHQKYGKVTLTEKGDVLAREVAGRHEVILTFLVDVLGVDVRTASKDACRMEHVISDSTFECLRKYVSEVVK